MNSTTHPRTTSDHGNGGAQPAFAHRTTEPAQTAPPLSRQVIFGIVFLALVATIAVLGSMATIPNTEGWYETVEKAPWSPPNSVFGPVWSVLYVLIAFAGWLVWRKGYSPSAPNAAQKPLTIYAIQLVLNGLWTPVFFAGYPVIGEAAWWIALVIIVLLIISVFWFAATAAPFTKVSAWIMVPYAAWLFFATSLNAAIIYLN